MVMVSSWSLSFPSPSQPFFLVLLLTCTFTFDVDLSCVFYLIMMMKLMRIIYCCLLSRVVSEMMGRSPRNGKKDVLLENDESYEVEFMPMMDKKKYMDKRL